MGLLKMREKFNNQRLVAVNHFIFHELATASAKEKAFKKVRKIVRETYLPMTVYHFVIQPQVQITKHLIFGISS